MLSKNGQITIEQIQLFEKLVGQLDGLHSEMLLMAKKSQNDAINTFKLRFVNNILNQWNDLLGERFRPFPDFKEFSGDDLPSNSDVNLMLVQYIEAAESMRSKYIETSMGFWHWRNHRDHRTYPPRKLHSR